MGGCTLAEMSLTDFMVACKEATGLSGLWALALGFFAGRGIGMVSYHRDDAQVPGAPRLGLVQHGFPEDWVAEYIEGRLGRVDPIPDFAASTTRPFLWSEIASLAELSPEQEAYLARMAEAELGDGLAMQVYGPHFRNAYVGLGFGGPAPQLSAAGIFELQCAAQIAHIRYCELTEHLHRTVTLSPREREILGWIAKGKSNAVIADILGISRHTVDTITRRMFDKLEVNDRTSAVIRGLGAGLVQMRSEDPL